MQACRRLFTTTRAFAPGLARRMASTSATPAKHEFIVILPDNEGVLEERMKVRPTHLTELKPNVGSFWLFGGAFMEEVPKEGETPKVKGSIMLAIAESKEEVIKQLQSDVYYKKVWDTNKIQIFPFRSAIREAM